MHGFAVFAARHALRFVVVVVVIGGLSARRRAGDRDRRADWRHAVRIRYGIAGLILGGTWVWRDNSPLWERVLRIVVIMLIVAPALRWMRRTRTEGDDQVTRRPLRTWRWFAVKLALIIAGSGLQLLLEQATSRTDAALIVGLLLFLAVALGGPWLTIRRIEAAARRRRQT
jgi:hypothetical protein